MKKILVELILNEEEEEDKLIEFLLKEKIRHKESQKRQEIIINE